jgi:hypothetical protein
LVGKLEGKIPLTKPELRWKENRMNLKEMGYENLEWIQLVKYRVQW